MWPFRLGSGQREGHTGGAEAVIRKNAHQSEAARDGRILRRSRVTALCILRPMRIQANEVFWDAAE